MWVEMMEMVELLGGGLHSLRASLFLVSAKVNK